MAPQDAAALKARGAARCAPPPAALWHSGARLCLLLSRLWQAHQGAFCRELSVGGDAERCSRGVVRCVARRFAAGDAAGAAEAFGALLAALPPVGPSGQQGERADHRTLPLR